MSWEANYPGISQERMRELVMKAFDLAYKDTVPTDAEFTPESIGATLEEFEAVNKFLDNMEKEINGRA